MVYESDYYAPRRSYTSAPRSTSYNYSVSIVQLSDVDEKYAPKDHQWQKE